MEQTSLWTLRIGDSELMMTPFAVCVVAAIACGLLLMWFTSRTKLKSGTVSTLGILMLPDMAEAKSPEQLGMELNQFFSHGEPAEP